MSKIVSHQRQGFVWLIPIVFVSIYSLSLQDSVFAEDSPQQTPKYEVRSEPLELPEKPYEKNSRKIFSLTPQFRPLEDIENDFEEMGEVIMDRATGRMWQKAGAEGYVSYEEAKAYIDELNRQKFAGYDDWRLPTIPELASLVEKDKQENGMYLSPLFDTTQFWCWSADVTIPKIAWLVDFKHGTVNAALRSYYNYVRAVRF